MKETYKFLVKKLPLILAGSIITTIMGVIAMILGYNSSTSWLKLSGVCTIIFALFGFATMCFAGYIDYKTKDIHIKKIRKNSGFLRASAYLAFAISFFIFGFELVKIILASYEESFSDYFTVWRVLRFVFALPCSAHFLFVALPVKFKRKRINIPKKILYVSSVSTILWSIAGLLATYFANEPGKNFSTMNILKIWQILVYLSFAVFFLFEAKFDHINQSSKGYIFTGCLAFICVMAFTLTNLICLALRIVPSRNCFSTPEMICLFAVGLYAFAKVYAIPNTMKYVIDNGDSHSSHSSKSGKHRHHHHHSDNVNAVTSENPVENNNTDQNNQ